MMNREPDHGSTCKCQRGHPVRFRVPIYWWWCKPGVDESLLQLIDNRRFVMNRLLVLVTHRL